MIRRAIYLLVCTVTVVFAIVYIAMATEKDVPYRNVHPDEQICREGLASPWTVLADADGSTAPHAADDEDDWVDPSNNETRAVEKEAIWKRRFRCSLQRHAIPVPSRPLPDLTTPLDYHLAFLEYRENGVPYSLVHEDDAPYTAAQVLALNGQRIPAGDDPPLPVSQLDVLLRHLSTGSNYVIVFVHGWRHDASLGDQNVADLRHYAAHAARFLRQRCASEKARGVAGEHCEMRVTAVYVGWRGARVNERAMQGHGPIASVIGQVAAIPTLFDRKPVSEQIAPAVLSALRSIDRALSPVDVSGKPKANAHANRMIVFGHSLGGNLLATGLEDNAIKAVQRHSEGQIVPPLVGNLAVLINPASEASKWTSIQREVWRRIAFHTSVVTPIETVIESHKFFPIEQRPIMISVTSARGFPPGGLRDGDCVVLEAMGHKATLDKIQRHEDQFSPGGSYDWATREVFSAFKGDFLPLAQRFAITRARIEGRPTPGTECGPPPETTWVGRIAALPARLLSSLLATFPFQNRNSENSRTIGHFDPPRPGTNFFSNNMTSAAPFGTTHEMFPARFGERERHNAYATIPNADIACEPADDWLQRARLAKAGQNGTFWNSAELGAHLDPAAAEGAPAVRFVHGYPLGGMAAITRASDPFWNMRASNSVISRHDGYRLSSFICAMNQLVMDDITRLPSDIVDRVSEPTVPARP